MLWKKNGCSVVLWQLCSLLAVTGSVGAVMLGAQQGNFSFIMGVAIVAVVALAGNLLLLPVHKLSSKHQLHTWLNGNAALVLEAVIAVILVAVGILLRVQQLESFVLSETEQAYFEAAQIASGQTVPQVVHGATYLYLQLLHLLFWFVGNKAVAAVVLQIVLQVLASCVLYFAVRSLAGKGTALMGLAFLMLPLYMVRMAVNLGPEVLYLLIYAITLCMVAGSFKRTSGNVVSYLLTGVLMGVCCYLDSFGITLLVFAAGVFTVERELPGRGWNSAVAVFLFQLLGAIAAFVAVIAVDAMLCGKSVFNVLRAWCTLYCPKGFGIQMNLSDLWIDIAVICGILLVGVAGFWYRKQYEKRGIWIGAALVYTAMLLCSMTVSPNGSVAYLYVLLAVLGGIGLEDVFAEPVMAAEPEGAYDAPAGLRETETTETIATSIGAVEQPPQIKFLDNPLPLPKKHEARVMDYGITDIADSDYDYDVAEDDDFDV